jgi:hypothetical protein
LEEREESYFPNCDDFREWCMERESLIVSQALAVYDKTISDSASLDYVREADSFYKFESEFLKPHPNFWSSVESVGILR